MQDRSGLAMLFLKENAEVLQDRGGFREWSGMGASTSYSTE